MKLVAAIIIAMSITACATIKDVTPQQAAVNIGFAAATAYVVRHSVELLLWPIK